MNEDPYLKLHPSGPTPENELCHCQGEVPLLLFDALGSNPVHCGYCKGEVLPECIGWTVSEVDDIAGWLGVRNAITHLWLESGECESWAKREQESIDSAVNRRGRALCEMIGTKRECYLGYSKSDDDDMEIQITACPLCGAKLEPLERKVRKHPLVNVCRKCRIAAWHERFHRF